jgi:hypothetical protein
LGDEPTQLRRIANATKAQFHRAQKEKDKATKALKKEKTEVLVQLKAVRDNVAA